MKKLFLLISFTGFFACNNKEEAKIESAVSEPKEEKVEYAYTIEKPDNWETGSKRNTQIVLQALRDFEMNNIEGSLNAFSDSVELRFNEYEAKHSKAEIEKMFKENRAKYQQLQVKMNDFESVRSKDGKEEYVSMWYMEKWQDQNGKWDSISIMEDVKMKDGKIIQLDQKTRKFAKK
ncbi:MAG: hypothetical protein H0U44_03340 [Flavisolibacter sp.]|jgi:hypothetical protein|nr:hypothetical protein [Flavisolibacter sp.]